MTGSLFGDEPEQVAPAPPPPSPTPAPPVVEPTTPTGPARFRYGIVTGRGWRWDHGPHDAPTWWDARTRLDDLGKYLGDTGYGVTVEAHPTGYFVQRYELNATGWLLLDIVTRTEPIGDRRD